MSNCNTIITFSSGRTVTINGDWVAALKGMGTICKFQGFQSYDGKPLDIVINMDLVETVKVVEGDD